MRASGEGFGEHHGLSEAGGNDIAPRSLQYAVGDAAYVPRGDPGYEVCRAELLFGAGGDNSVACGRKLADGGSALGVVRRRCTQTGCGRQASFGKEGSGRASYCREHAESEMVNVVNRRCAHDGCDRQAYFGEARGKCAVYCMKHAVDGMVNVRTRSCNFEGCIKYPFFGPEGSKHAIFCRKHAVDGMVNVRVKLCAHAGCRLQPCFGEAGGKLAIYCSQHADPGMVNVRARLCAHDGCRKHPCFGMERGKLPVYCRQHADEGMVNVRAKLCAHAGCPKHPSYGRKGVRHALYCRQHADEGMVNVRARVCAFEGCGKHPCFGEEGGKHAMYCRQHADDGMINFRARSSPRAGCSGVPSFVFEGSRTADFRGKLDGDDMLNGSSTHYSSKRPSPMPVPTPTKKLRSEWGTDPEVLGAKGSSAPCDIRPSYAEQPCLGTAARESQKERERHEELPGSSALHPQRWGDSSKEARDARSESSPRSATSDDPRSRSRLERLPMGVSRREMMLGGRAEDGIHWRRAVLGEVAVVGRPAASRTNRRTPGLHLGIIRGCLLIPPGTSAGTVVVAEDGSVSSGVEVKVESNG